MDATCFINPGLFVGDTAAKGRGMFTVTAIAADTVIETSPVIIMSAAERPHLDKTLLHDYIFEWQPDGQELCCMALGYIPVYNHSYTSNCEYLMDYEEGTMSIITIRDVAANEELTINYNGDWNDNKPIWFDAV